MLTRVVMKYRKGENKNNGIISELAWGASLEDYADRRYPVKSRLPREPKEMSFGRLWRDD